MGPWGITALAALAVLATETGRSYLKKALKVTVHAGCHMKEAAGEVVEKAKAYSDDIVAEAKAERSTLEADKHKSKRKTKATA